MGCTCSYLGKTEVDGKSELSTGTGNVIKAQLKEYPVLLYSTTQSLDCQYIKDLLLRYGIKFEYFELDRMSKE
jgi:hypothetical protein